MYLLVLACIVVSFFFFYIKGCVKIHIGKSPFPNILIAYKYAYYGKTLCRGSLGKLQSALPGLKAFKICYSAKERSNFIEYAYGVVLEDPISPDNAQTLAYLERNGFSLFSLPYVGHSISVFLSVSPWFPFGKYLKLAVCYKRVFDFVERHSLCAYPVLEIYDKTTITVMVPLFQQDSFIVPEAQRMVYGRKMSSLLTNLTPRLTYPKKKELKSPAIERRG